MPDTAGGGFPARPPPGDRIIDHAVGLWGAVVTAVAPGGIARRDEGVIYAPHTSKGFAAPPNKTLLLIANGLLVKAGLWRARRQGSAERLRQLAARPDHPRGRM